MVAETSDGVPPDPTTLERVQAAGLVPGVDLREFRWLTEHAAHVTGRDRVAVLPHHLQRAAGGRDLARLLLDLGLVREGSPPAAWVTSVAEGGIRGEAQAWFEVLGATYIETCVAVLRGMRPPM